MSRVRLDEDVKRELEEYRKFLEDCFGGISLKQSDAVRIAIMSGRKDDLELKKVSKKRWRLF